MKTIIVGMLCLGLCSSCATRGEDRTPRHVQELRAYLRNPELLQRLNVKELDVMEQEVDTASICVPSGTHSYGMVYYTVQRGWYLPKDEERLEHRGDGWVILGDGNR